jgi:hypothetical protein
MKLPSILYEPPPLPAIIIGMGDDCDPLTTKVPPAPHIEPVFDVAAPVFDDTASAVPVFDVTAPVEPVFDVTAPVFYVAAPVFYVAAPVFDVGDKVVGD